MAAMVETVRREKAPEVDQAILISSATAEHMWLAFEQMELLVGSRDAQCAIEHLAMLVCQMRLLRSRLI